MKFSSLSFRAFTLVELMVAIVITVLMLTMIQQIFIQTTSAVSLGVGTSDIINNAAAVADQLRIDAGRMIGPDDAEDEVLDDDKGGILIILNREIDGVTVGDIERGTGPRSVRSDQLVFIARTNDSTPVEYPITPSTNGSYVNNLGAPFVRIWYGHVRRTQASYWDDSHDDFKIYEPDRTTRSSTGALGKDGANELGNVWILGRQALFLNENVQGQEGLPPIHAQGGWYNAQRVGDFSMGMTLAKVNFLYMGTTDTASFSLQDPASGAGVRFGPMVNAGPASAPDANRRLFSEQTASQYKANAWNYTYGTKRLRVNLNPYLVEKEKVGRSKWQWVEKPEESKFESWRIAQMHPAFMRGVSDFIVEFAADLHHGAQTGGSYNPDGNIDVDEGGNIRWYSHFNRSEHPLGSYDPYSNLEGNTSMPHADGGFVWRHDDDANLSNFTFSNPPSKWPYMIRIRWRMHDERGQVYGTNDESGRWFEQIIKVNRP